MGQQPGRDGESARLDELLAMRKGTYEHIRRLQSAAVAAAAEGIPPPTGSARAQWHAALAHLQQLATEQDAICDRLRSLSTGNPLPMPEPTPPLRLPPPPAAAEAAAAPALLSACEEQPGTPLGGAGWQRGQQAGGGSSSSEEGAAAGPDERSEAAPLLAAEAGRPAMGLRRRQGNGQDAHASNLTFGTGLLRIGF
ncbi:hypothetical protein ABPG75_009197 [Micractinium tetrahymenae]